SRLHFMLRWLLRLIVFLPAGAVLAYYYYLPRALLGFSDVRWLDPPTILSPRAHQYFESLPESVRKGLQQPFGIHQELAWKFLQGATTTGTQWLRSLENRNRDVLTVLTALILGGSLVAYRSSATLLTLQTLQFGWAVLFYAYFLTVRTSTIT